MNAFFKDLKNPVLITSDLHLSDNPRDAYRHEFMTKTLPRMLKKDPAYQALYVLGDLTESKDFHSSWLVNAVVDHFKQLSEIVPVMILKGNHDYTQEDNPFYRFLRHIPNITWINKPTCLKNGHLFLPHTGNWKRSWKDIEFTLQPYKAIFCHQTFEGSHVGPTKMEGLPRDIFPLHVQVFSGDVHHPQRIDNIHYVGAPYRVDFGDDYIPRVIKLFENGVRGSIPVKGPQKHLLDLDTRDNLYHEGSPFNEGDILKVRVKVSAQDRERWPEIRKEIAWWASQNRYTLWQVKPVFDAAVKARAWKTSPESDKETLVRYGKVKNVPERTLQTGQWLRNQV